MFDRAILNDFARALGFDPDVVTEINAKGEYIEVVTLAERDGKPYSEALINGEWMGDWLLTPKELFMPLPRRIATETHYFALTPAVQKQTVEGAA